MCQERYRVEEHPNWQQRPEAESQQDNKGTNNKEGKFNSLVDFGNFFYLVAPELSKDPPSNFSSKRNLTVIFVLKVLRLVKGEPKCVEVYSCSFRHICWFFKVELKPDLVFLEFRELPSEVVVFHKEIAILSFIGVFYEHLYADSVCNK